MSLLKLCNLVYSFKGLSEKMDGTRESHFVSRFLGNVELIRVVTEEISVSPAAVDCEFGCMLRLIDGSYLSGAVENV